MHLDDPQFRLEDWLALAEAQREVVIDQLLERLPSTVSRIEGEGPLPHFQSCETHFIFVPASTVTVGLTRERAEAAYAALEQSPLQIFSPEVHVPAWVGEVPMHLAATVPMVHEGYDWVPRQSVPDLRAQLRTRGWRAPTEAEWELQFWSLRTLAPIAFSPFGELCQDSWAPGYTLPFDAGSLSRGGEHEVVRLASFDANSPATAMPSRRPLRSTSMVAMRPIIDIPRGPNDR